jgi:hypothetical protein
MPDERRAASRVRGPFDGTWDGASGRHTVRIADIGAGGAFVESWASLPSPGERFTIEVRLGDHQVALTSEVVYVDRNAGFGVRFVDNDPAAIESLESAVRELTGRR